MALSRSNGITVVVVEHVLSVLAAMVERLVVLHNATVIADGTPSRDRARSAGDRGVSRHQAERVAMTALTIANLSVAYGDMVAVRDVSFSFEAGEVFVLLGANGAGKTSILRCISGLVPRAIRHHRLRRPGAQRPQPASGRAGRHLARARRQAHLSQSVGRGEPDGQLHPAPRRQDGGAGRRLCIVPAACRTAPPVRRHSVRAASSRCWRSAAR